MCSNFPGGNVAMQNICVGFPGASVPIPSELRGNTRLSYQVGTSEASPRIAAIVARTIAEAKKLKLANPVHAAYTAVTGGAVHGKAMDVELGGKFLIHHGTTEVKTKITLDVDARDTVNKHGAKDPEDGAYNEQKANASSTGGGSQTSSAPRNT